MKKGDIVKLISVAGNSNVDELIKNKYIGMEYKLVHIERTRKSAAFTSDEGHFCILDATFPVDEEYKRLVLNGAVIEFVK